MKIIYLLVNDNDDLLSIFTLPVIFILIEFFFHGLYKGACHFQSVFPVGSTKSHVIIEMEQREVYLI